MDRAHPYQSHGYAEDSEPVPDNRELANEPLSDLGNARRLVARYGANLRALGDTRPAWFAYDGRRWKSEGAKAAALAYCHRTADDVRLEASALEEDLGLSSGRGSRLAKADLTKRVASHKKWAITSGNRNRWQGMLEACVPSLQVRMDDLDADPLVLNLRNGTLGLHGLSAETGVFPLRAHSRSDWLTRLAGTDYVPDAEAPRFRAFLDRILPDREKQNFLQRFSGYVLSGSTKEQRLLIAYGTGANGKSTFFDIIAQVMGDYAATIDIKSLLHNDFKRGADASPDLARLPGTRLVLANEPEASDRLSESLVKAITGGDRIVVRGLYRDPFEFSPTFKLVILSNTLPAISGTDGGIWRRITLLPFDQKIPESEQRSKAELTAELMREAPGILRWCLDGWLLYQELGLAIPNSVRTETDNYRADNNPVSLFLETATETHPGGHVTASKLYEAYCKWCEANAIAPRSQRWFGVRMTEFGYKRQTVGITYYSGLRLVKEQFGDVAAATEET